MQNLEDLFKKVKDGKISVDEALKQAKFSYYQDLNFAKIDHYRKLRRGFPEVVFCEGKHPDHAAKIIEELSKHDERVLATRASRDVYEKLGKLDKKTRYHELAAIIEVGEPPEGKGLVTVVTGGTADIPVAEEAYISSKALGNNTDKIYDIGIAGLHRLIDNLEKIDESRVVIAVAGMEGALPSVLAGLIDKPVIGVPTSVGYGTHLNGMTPLFAMLNSCSTIAVMNIDNGFGAAYFASLINRG